ncbi:hypothetical protein Tco_0892481 [Tanacetum coccineum]|uniref:Reverse transcriptase domain-containing protein n=1 Tax=Tanacetum coccineum TaxID=301880 RepID=A0ABQ5CBE4_9ASTR
MKKGLKNPYLICDICQGAHEADECDQNKPTELVCLSGGDIYDDPSLKFKDELSNFIQEQWVDTIERDEKWVEAEEEGGLNEVHAVSFYPKPEPVESHEWKALENRLKQSSIEPPKLELKELLEHLKYAFLQENNQLSVVISSPLSATEKTRLLKVLRNHKGANAWSIADIKGIDSSFCTHKILIEDEFKLSVQP